MDLTKKLWRFWGDLNSGKIDWSFLDSTEWTTEEKDKVADMLVDRGFVKDAYVSGRGLWVVVAVPEKLLNPSHKGKTLYFTARKYADGYRNYLYSLGKVSEDCEVREA